MCRVVHILLILLAIELTGCGKAREVDNQTQSKQTNDLLDRATAKFQEKEYKAARDLCMEVISLDPSDWTAYFLRGTTHFHKQHPAVAIPDLNRAVELCPSFAPLYVYRSM